MLISPKYREEEMLIAARRTAGIAGANTVGIARNSQLVSVKLLNNNGDSTLSGELAGYSAAIERHKEDMDLSGSTYRGAVWVMSEIPSSLILFSTP